VSRYGTTRSSYGRDVHPGVLRVLPDDKRAEVEAHRHYVLDGNGADDEPDHDDDSQDDGWTVLN
jgi:hypothetical protein